MPPKKSRAASSQPVSASQPTPEPSRPTRTSGRKRRHSDGSNASEVSSVVETTEVKTKKQKRGRGRPAKQEPEQEAIVEEEEGTEEETVHAAPRWPDLSEAQAGGGSEADGDEIEVSQQSSSKHVHFGGDLQYDDDHTTATNITPHPRTKMSIKRKTLSPNAGTERKRFKTASTRTSLPATLSQEQHDPARSVQNLLFAPLKEILQERVRQLIASKNARRNSNVNGEDVDVEEGGDMLVLDSQEEIDYPRPPTTPLTPLLKASKSRVSLEEDENATPGRKMRSEWEKERRQFQDAILALNEVANKAKSDLQILNIELGALGFAGEDSSAVVSSIREAFARVREELEEQLPSTIPDNADNDDILDILSANVKEFANRLRVADGELNEKSTLISNLGGQVDNLIDRLAEKEVRSSTLHQQWQAMDRSNEEKAAQIVELEDELTAEREKEDDWTQEKINFEASVARLTESLDQYRSEETRLTDTVTRMEEEHRKTVAAMNKERQETVQELEDAIDRESGARGDYQRQVEEHQATIDTLEARTKDVQTERDSLHEQLETVKKERDGEIEANEEAQANLEDREAEVKDLESRVSRLETELDELNGELQTLRDHNATERRQREAAEKEIDDRDQQIGDIDRKLQDQGKQANELRQKLFEVQQKNDEKVKEMRDDAARKDEAHQADLIKATEARESAEDVAEERSGTVEDLQGKLDEVESRLRDMLAEKDARIANLEDDLAQRDMELQTLRDDLRAAQREYEVQADQHNERAQELEGSIAALEETIDSHEETIRTLERDVTNSTQEHNSQTEERDAAIAELNARLAELEAEKQQLLDDKVNLEGRVTREAESMLEMQNEKQDEIDSLREIISDKQGKILVVEEKAKAADAQWQEVLTAREEEIDTLKTTTQTSGQSIDDLTSANEAIKRRFRDYVRRSSGVISGLQDKVRELNAQAEQDGDELMREGEDALGDLEALTAGEEDVGAQASSTSQTKSQVKVKKRVGRKKRVEDSGIGLDGDESMLAV